MMNLAHLGMRFVYGAPFKVQSSKFARQFQFAILPIAFGSTERPKLEYEPTQFVLASRFPFLTLRFCP